MVHRHHACPPFSFLPLISFLFSLLTSIFFSLLHSTVLILLAYELQPEADLYASTLPAGTLICSHHGDSSRTPIFLNTGNFDKFTKFMKQILPLACGVLFYDHNAHLDIQPILSYN